MSSTTTQSSQKKVSFEGDALMSVEVDEEGVPRNPHVVHSLNKQLDEQAIESIKNLRFQPATKYGVPIPATIVMQYHFRLY